MEVSQQYRHLERGGGGRGEERREWGGEEEEGGEGKMERERRRRNRTTQCRIATSLPIHVDIFNPPYSPDTYRPLVLASVKQPNLTSSFEEVGYLGDANIVGHVRLTSGGRSPVDTDIVTHFEQSFQSIFILQHLQQCMCVRMRE